jgi:hypothetical protein
MIISVPVQTATWRCRPLGAPVIEVGSHESVAGVYRPPVFREGYPPQTIISVPVQIAVW